MKKAVRNVLLCAALFAALLLCSVLVLFLLDVVFDVGFANLWLTGFKTALVACAVLAAAWYVRRRSGDRD